MMIIAPNSRAHKGEKERGAVKGEYGGIWEEEEGYADYGGMMQLFIIVYSLKKMLNENLFLVKVILSL